MGIFYGQKRNSADACLGLHPKNMSESTKNAIKYIVLSPAKKLYSFNLKDESLNELKLITKVFFDEKLEKQYKM